MDREPTFKRQVRAVFRWFGFGPREDVDTVTRRSLREIEKTLVPSKRLEDVVSGESREISVVKRGAKQILEDMHDQMDRRSIENLNRTLEAAEETYDHALSLTEKAHKLRHLPGSLDRREQLDGLEHRARMAETAQRVDKADPASGALRRRAEEEALKTQIAKEKAGQRYYESQPRSAPQSAEEVDDEAGLNETERQRRAQARDYIEGTDG